MSSFNRFGTDYPILGYIDPALDRHMRRFAICIDSKNDPAAQLQKNYQAQKNKNNPIKNTHHVKNVIYIYIYLIFLFKKTVGVFTAV